MKEIRLTEIRTATDPAGSETELIIEGRPIVFDQATTIHDPAGEYTETIMRGALDNADLSDVHLFVNHNSAAIPLARVPKTMQINVDPAGMTFRAVLPNTEAGREAHEAVKRGDLAHMSFAFTVAPGGDSWQGNNRTINRIDKVLECSIVAFPAYPQTSVEARAAQKDADNRRRAIIACNQIMMKGI